MTVPGLGLAWIPYLVGGVALCMLGITAVRRSRTRRVVSVGEFLFLRGSMLMLLAMLLARLADAASDGDGLTAIDRPIWSWLVANRSNTLTGAAKVVTDLGGALAMGALAAVVFVVLVIRPHSRGLGLLVAAVTGGAGLLVAIAKPVVGRVRPPEEYRLVSETHRSFPSAHALASMAVMSVLVIVVLPRIHSGGRRVVIVGGAAAFVLAVGLSRVYLGVHWPTDILGAWLSGFGWLLLCLTFRHVWRTYPLVFRVRQRELFRHNPSEATSGPGETAVALSGQLDPHRSYGPSGGDGGEADESARLRR